jgi:hypothetical protein
MSDSESLLSDHEVSLDPAIASQVTPGSERVVVKCREYLRHLGIRAASDPSVIWRLGEEYERNKKKYWRCGICNKNKMLAIDSETSSALRHIKKVHNIDKYGRRIRSKQTNVKEAFSAAQTVV